jgi:hypothetical protein
MGATVWFRAGKINKASGLMEDEFCSARHDHFGWSEGKLIEPTLTRLELGHYLAIVIPDRVNDPAHAEGRQGGFYMDVGCTKDGKEDDCDAEQRPTHVRCGEQSNKPELTLILVLAIALSHVTGQSVFHPI